MSTNLLPALSSGRNSSTLLSLLSGAAVVAAPAQQTESLILFHGFFFMEFQNDKLVVASPRIQGHELLTQGHDLVRDIPLTPWDGTIASLQFKPATIPVQDFPAEMLQFSRKTIGIADGTFFIDMNTLDKSKFACLTMLPLPKKITPLRLGNKSDFNILKGRVADSISAQSAKQVALIICLHYDSDTPVTTNCYAEQFRRPDATEIDADLGMAGTVFGSSFDLKIDKAKPVARPVQLNPLGNLPVGVHDIDLKALEEMETSPPSSPVPHTVEVTTCPLFGVRS